MGTVRKATINYQCELMDVSTLKTMNQPFFITKAANQYRGLEVIKIAGTTVNILPIPANIKELNKASEAVEDVSLIFLN